MAFTEAARAVPISAGSRVSALNRIAAIRREVFKEDSTAELHRFFDEMRDVRDPLHKENRRALGAILYLANIPAARHDVDFSELTIAEQAALIAAMNQLRAVVSLFPRRLSMPN